MKKKKYIFFLYLLIFFVIIFFTYFFIPKFFDYSPQLIQESFKKNNNINIKNISIINYKIFPTPRLVLPGVDLEFDDNILKVDNAEAILILNPSNIINYKVFNYNKLEINGGLTNIEINRVNQIFDLLKEQNKINFKKNTIIFLEENKKLFEIKDSLIKLNSKNNIQKLNINGIFYNYKTSFFLKNETDKINIKIAIPELNISTNILLKNEDNFKSNEGLVNIKVLDNFFQFNLIRDKNIKINNGLARSSLANFSFNGDLSFKPYFFFNFNVEPSTLNIEKLIVMTQQKYFSENSQATEFMRKMNGSLNFSGMFEGIVVFKNSEILFQNFKLNKEDQIFIDARVSEFGKKEKIEFNLIHNVKNIKIFGFVTPSDSKVTFEKIIFDKEVFTEEKVKNYEEKFKNDVINNLLSNFFNEKKIKKFFQNF